LQTKLIRKKEKAREIREEFSRLYPDWPRSLRITLADMEAQNRAKKLVLIRHAEIMAS